MRYYRCAACGDLNRVPPPRTAKTPSCTRCGAGLDLTGRPRDLADDELRLLIALSPVPVVVDFWAPWSDPSRIAAPHLERFAQRHSGEVIVVRVNADVHRQSSRNLGIQTIPSLAVYRDGRLVARHGGVLLGPQIDTFVTPHLAHVWAVT